MLGKLVVYGVFIGIGWIVAPFIISEVLSFFSWFYCLAWWLQGLVIIAIAVVTALLGGLFLFLIGRAGK